MYIIKHNEFVNVDDNPYWCNDKGNPCKKRCSASEQDNPANGRKSCKHYYNPKIHNKELYNTFRNNRYYEGLGSYSTVSKTTSRLSLLRKEYDNFDKRTKWGDVNAKDAKKYLKKLIIKEEGK